VWHVHEPTERSLRDFLDRQEGEPFSYAQVGASRDGDAEGYDLLHARTRLGTGASVFAAGCQAIRCWKTFPASWMRIDAPLTPIVPGVVVAVTARAFGLWWLNACRIVYVIDEMVPVRRFGFAYGTLRQHVESGEECFSVEQHDDDGVWYDVRSFSRPRYWMARMARPLVRRLQRRFLRDSLASMRSAVAAGAAPAGPGDQI
jgi:uncharacterized protein (UPF0548 family)